MLNEIKAIKALAESLANEYPTIYLDEDEAFDDIMGDPYKVTVLYSSFDTTSESGELRDHDLEVAFDLVHDTVIIEADGHFITQYPLTLNDLTNYSFEKLYNTALTYVPYA